MDKLEEARKQAADFSFPSPDLENNKLNRTPVRLVSSFDKNGITEWM